jgi:hypothetical protein
LFSENKIITKTIQKYTLGKKPIEYFPAFSTEEDCKFTKTFKKLQDSRFKII